MMSGVLFVVGLAVFGRAQKGFVRAKVAVDCPATSHLASLVALKDEASGRYMDVVRCSALRGDVTCDRACLGQVNPPLRA
jgi:hypothetical protein